MISNIIPSHDADTLNLDFGVFIAKRAKRYRTSQAAIVAALRPSFTPSQPETHAPAADTSTIAPVDEATDGEEGISLPTPPSVEPIQPRVQGRQQEVARLHAEHPDWPAKMIGAEMGISGSNVSQHATRLGITLPTIRNYTATKAAKTTAALKAQAMAEQPPVNAPAKPPTLADQIKAHLVDHPDATLRDVTDAIGGTLQSVGWAAQKAGIILRKYTPEERSEATAKGIAARKAGVAPSLPNRPIREVITHPTRGAGPSTRFYVRDKAGRYVHQGLDPSPTGPGPLMTDNRKWAWFDNAQRYAGACKKWPELSTMRREAPQP